MHFATNAVPAEIPAQLRRFVSITGWKPWKRRLEWLFEQVRANPTMPFFLNERFGLELAFEQIVRHRDQTSRHLWPPETPEQQRFYSFLAMVVRCYQRLTPVGQVRLKGMMEDALKSDYGLASLAFEMKVAAHLMTSGFDVTFHDIEGSGRFDYLVEKDDVEAEIECKLISGDIGRQIHLKKFHHLGTDILPVLTDFSDRESGGYLIRVLIPGRLNGSKNQNSEIRHLTSLALSKSNSCEHLGGLEITISSFPIEKSPFGQLSPENISEDIVQKFLSSEFKLENKNVLFQLRPNKTAILFVVESAKKDAVLKGIHRQLKDAARYQFSGYRPGVLCCEFADMTEDKLLELGNDKNKPTGLDFMVSDLLKRRPQIHTLVFTTPGTVRIEKAGLGTSISTSIQESGPAYLYRNDLNALADDPKYDIF